MLHFFNPQPVAKHTYISGSNRVSDITN